MADKNKRLYGQYFTITNPFETVAFYKWMLQIKDLHETTILEPFAGKVMDAKIPFLQFNFDSDEEFMEYIDEYVRTSTFKSDVTVNKDDKVVMMIKCSADYEDARYVLLCKVSEA